MSAHSQIEIPRCHSDDGYPTVGLPFILRELGQRHYSPAKACAYVGLLIRDFGFPPPFPALVGRRDAKTLTTEVVIDSKWSRRPVELWIEGFLPPANADAIDAAAMDEAAEDMDAAAAGLRLVGGRDAR